MDTETIGERICEKKFRRQGAEKASMYSGDGMNAVPLFLSTDIRTTDVSCPESCPGKVPKSFKLLGVKIPLPSGCPMEGDS